MNEKLLQELVDREAIRYLKHYHYCHCADRGIAGDEAAMRELVAQLAPDIAIDFTGFPVAEGLEAVSAFYLETVPSLLTYSQHRVCNEVITLDGDRARGLWYIECPIVLRPGNMLGLKGSGLIVGRYEEEYVRIDGRWKWRQITAFLDTYAEWDTPWVTARLLRHNDR